MDITMKTMRMMKMSINNEIEMISVLNHLVTTRASMLMRREMSFTFVGRGAFSRVIVGDFQRVFLEFSISRRMMKMSIMKEIEVTIMLDLEMTTTLSMKMTVS